MALKKVKVGHSHTVAALKLREAWLNNVAAELAPAFEELGHKLPSYRVTCGFPSTGRKSKRIGECWTNACSADGHFEIFIHPKEADPLNVAAILCHELTHAAVGLREKHGGQFKVVALAMGLEGPMKATTPGEEFVSRFEPIHEKLGDYPHAALNTDGGQSSKGPKQTTRLIKVACPACGYVARVTRTWLEDVGAPFCGCTEEHTQMEEC